MAIQEMDLHIKHRSGQSNASADALLRHPVNDAVVSSLSTPRDETSGPVLSEPTREKFNDMSAMQKSCVELKDMFLYLSRNVLPGDAKESRRIVSESQHFDLIDGILHHENPHFPGRWCVAVPVELRLPLLENAHGGLLAGQELAMHAW